MGSLMSGLGSSAGAPGIAMGMLPTSLMEPNNNANLSPNQGAQAPQMGQGAGRPAPVAQAPQTGQGNAGNGQFFQSLMSALQGKNNSVPKMTQMNSDVDSMGNAISAIGGS